jgi:hypothetical protein
MVSMVVDCSSLVVMVVLAVKLELVLPLLMKPDTSLAAVVTVLLR